MTDLLIVGGGIMGLWAAVMADRAGLKTILVEKARLGAGASGGLLGALMPHMPDRWNAKKQFQFEALVSLEAEIAALEAETGLSAGYRRSGRVMPLSKPHLREIALRHEQDALDRWRDDDRQFFWHVQDSADHRDWPVAASCQRGIVFDTLAARVAPRLFIAMLEAALRRSANVKVEEHCEVKNLDFVAGQAGLSDGRFIAFGACVLAAGHESFPFLDRLRPVPESACGSAVKGQAALLKADVDPALPVLFQDGLYIVPHEGGHVAVGSTSEDNFSAPFSTDNKLDDLIDRARELAPALRDATVVERWAGLRPKAIGRDPMAGPHPHYARLHVLTGGFKISFGIAQRLAENVVGGIAGQSVPELPPSFRCETHLSLLGRVGTQK